MSDYNKLREALEDVFDVLDAYLGDSDPIGLLPSDDDELRNEHPLIWCCVRIRRALKESGIEP